MTTHVAFSVWSLWSVVVLFMPESVYGLTAVDKLLLVATATLVGGCVRIPYTMATARFGGRSWAAFSSLILLIPTAGTLVLVVHPGRFGWYLVFAALTGLGGGNYSASLANVELFYPERLKGFALGVTGGIGNLGVAAAQLVGLLVLAAAGGQRPYLVCAIYLVLLAVVGVGAALRMDNLVISRIDVKTIGSLLPMPDAWLLSVLYTAAFGSFIGFAFSFVQVLNKTFMDAGENPAQAALDAGRIAFVGPLLAALARVYGGWLADRTGGGRLTFAVFVGMSLATAVLVAASSADDRAGGTSALGVGLCITGFIALFILAGIGNGSVLKLIPSVFERRSRALGFDVVQRRAWARSRSGALIGLATSIGAFGGVAIDLVLRQAYLSRNTETPAFQVFLVAYLVVATLTWLAYVRPMRRAPQSGESESIRAAATESTSLANPSPTHGK